MFIEIPTTPGGEGQATAVSGDGLKPLTSIQVPTETSQTATGTASPNRAELVPNRMAWMPAARLGPH